MARIRPAVILALSTVALVLLGAGIWATTTGASSATAAGSRAAHRAEPRVSRAAVPARRSSSTTVTRSAATQPAKTHAAIAPPTIAAVFGAGPPGHSCSAGVVASATHDLLVTAAHCVSGEGTNLTVAPGYHNGDAPYGTWSVTAIFVDPAWASEFSEGDDVAILRVAPHSIGGTTVSLQDVTGAVQLGTTPTGRQAVTVQGFNAGSNDQSVACTTDLAFKHGNPILWCDGFAGGSSGSPWTVVGADHITRIIGVIGGLNQGGCKTQRSFSSAFGANVMALLARAERGGTDGDDAPTAPPPAACAQTDTN